MSEQSQCTAPSNESAKGKVSSPRGRRRSTIEAGSPWKHYGPSGSDWEVTRCFKEGHLFLLINPASQHWALYNDTFMYEMHAIFTFGAESRIQPLSGARIEVSVGSDNETTLTVTVYPMETVTFLRGDRQRYRCSFVGKALSKTYLQDERETAAAHIAQAFSAITAEDGTDTSGARTGPPTQLAPLTEETCLARCLEQALPFVDPVFFPGEQSLWPHPVHAAAPTHPTSSLPRTPLHRTGSASISVSDTDVGAREVGDHCDGTGASRPAPSAPPSALTPCAWQRPCEYLPPSLCGRVELFRGPVTPRSIQRGRLGNSWFVSALAAVAESDAHVRALFERSSRQTAVAAAEEAVGAYRVILNRDGWWHQLLIDAYLPVVGRQPRYARSREDPCELWVSLLEKAYAKRNGAYANIASGDPLFAFRDLTGFPTTRLDVPYLESFQSTTKAQAFFARLASDVDNGHLYLFDTPSSSSDPRDAVCDFRANGILTGYAYTAIGTLTVPASTASTWSAQLVVLRNPWSPGEQWKGRWHARSPLWDQHADAAAAFPGCAAGTDDTIAVEWPDEVQRFFTGCGMAYCHFGYADYRMPCTFVRHVPDVCVEVTVTEPTSLTFILSQHDHRGTREQGKDYAAVVLCVASGTAAVSAQSTTHTAADHPLSASPPAKDEYTVLAHSSLDAESPSDHCTFLQARDISVTYTFEPARSPYLIVPRRLMLAPTANSAGSRNSGISTTNLTDLPAEPEQEELPFVLGVLSQLPFTPLGQAQLRLRRLHDSNPVFENYATFPNVSTEASVTVMAQRRVGHGSVVRLTSSLNSL